MRTEYGKFDQISQNSKKIFAHAKIYPNDVFVYLWYLIQGFNLVLVLQWFLNSKLQYCQEKQRTHGWNGQLSSLLLYIFKNTVRSLLSGEYTVIAFYNHKEVKTTVMIKGLLKCYYDRAFADNI